MRLALAVATITFLAAAGCKGDRTPPPTAKCTKLAELCKLPDGPLGVCNAEPCAPGATPPCFRCAPQH